MSFTINASGNTKEALRESVATQLDAVVVEQPTHAADRTMAEDTAMAAVNMLGDLPQAEEGQAEAAYTCNIVGSLGWTPVEGKEPETFTSVFFSVQASIATH